jgi:hypothetical protein
MSKTKTMQLLTQAQQKMLVLLESAGALSGQIREALSDASDGNFQGSAIVCDDALLTVAEIETALSEVGAGIAKFQQQAEGVQP